MNVDGWTVLAQVVNFLLLVWLLKRFLYEPVQKVIAQRQARLLEERRAAEARAAAARAEEEKYKELVARLEAERRQILEQAAAQAEKERERLLEQAAQEVAAARDQMYERLRAERAELEGQIRRGILQEASRAAEKILAELAGVAIADALIDALERRIASLPPLEIHSQGTAVPVEVRTSFEPTPDQRERLRALVARWTGREQAQVSFVHDRGLILGVEIAGAGESVSWSARDVLESIEGAAFPRLGSGPGAEGHGPAGALTRLEADSRPQGAVDHA